MANMITAWTLKNRLFGLFRISKIAPQIHVGRAQIRLKFHLVAV